VIEEANWLTLTDDIPGQTFDAVICLGNSFAHMPDTTGDQSGIRYANNNRQCALNFVYYIIPLNSAYKIT
jgi:glycine N-methyltransferase